MINEATEISDIKRFCSEYSVVIDEDEDFFIFHAQHSITATVKRLTAYDISVCSLAAVFRITAKTVDVGVD